MGEGGGDETVKALVEQIGRLNPEQLDKVRKAVLFGSNANLKDLDRSAFIMNRPSSPRGRREASPKGRRELSPKERTPVNRLGPEDYGYLPNQDSTSSLVSNSKDKARFVRTSSATDHPIDILLREKGMNMSRYLVVVSSLSLDWKELVKIPGVAGYELRMLWHLYFLRARKIHVVMCTSQYIPEELIKYYLSYLPGDISVEDARSRLTMVCCNDMTSRSVTEKLLTRPRTLQRIKNCIESDKAAMTCFNSTDAEVELAKSLNIPLFGNDTQGAFWGTKTGNRQVFLDAGVDHPDGSYREIFTEEELCEEILALLKRCPSARKIMVKLNDSFSGEGNTVLRVDETLQEALKDSDQKAKMVITEKLHNSLEFVAPGLTWARYYTQFQNLGGICEVFVEGAAEAKTSPSCQAFLNNNGDVRILATHEQMLNNQIYVGCKFPANEEYAKDIALGNRGERAHGGTTLPIMTLNLLCQDGVFNAATSEFIASDGYPRYYITSDTLRKPSYKGLLIEDLLAIIKRHSTEIEWNQRPGAPETGVIFHLVTLLSELGKCGVMCVGRSRDEAEELFQRVKEILDQECEVGEAEMSLVIEGDSADMLS